MPFTKRLHCRSFTDLQKPESQQLGHTSGPSSASTGPPLFLHKSIAQISSWLCQSVLVFYSQWTPESCSSFCFCGQHQFHFANTRGLYYLIALSCVRACNSPGIQGEQWGWSQDGHRRPNTCTQRKAWGGGLIPGKGMTLFRKVRDPFGKIGYIEIYLYMWTKSYSILMSNWNQVKVSWGFVCSVSFWESTFKWPVRSLVMMPVSPWWT